MREKGSGAHLELTSVFRHAEALPLQQGAAIFEPGESRQGHSITLTDESQGLANQHRDILFFSHDVGGH